MNPLNVNFSFIKKCESLVFDILIVFRYFIIILLCACKFITLMFLRMNQVKSAEETKLSKIINV